MPPRTQVPRLQATSVAGGIIVAPLALCRPGRVDGSDFELAGNTATPDLFAGHAFPVALTGVCHNVLRQLAEAA